MKTLYLDPSLWDLALDISGNIALASNPYSLAQDAACAVRSFQGETWYDTAAGIPYFNQILGQFPPLQIVKGYMVQAALTVPEVVSAAVFFSNLTSARRLVGQVQITDKTGAVTAAGF